MCFFIDFFASNKTEIFEYNSVIYQSASQYFYEADFIMVGYNQMKRSLNDYERVILKRNSYFSINGGGVYAFGSKRMIGTRSPFKAG